MRRQLDILAIEPFHGGARRAMLEAIAHCSRHRWRVLKLPARRMERRLLVSATWFAEHLARNNVGPVDLVFASEALNLADFFRLRPEMARRPSVVYFHDNQLPEQGGDHTDSPTDLVNLNSAMAATEIWFNSLYNLRTFLSRASALVARHPELSVRNPMPSLAAKAHLVPPPIDLSLVQELTSDSPAWQRDPRSLLIDVRDGQGDDEVIAGLLEALARRGESTKTTLIGRLRNAPSSVRYTTLDERDERSHLRALAGAGMLISNRHQAAHDDLVVRALAGGALPIVSETGIYPEILPKPMHRYCLHDGSVQSMLDRILNAWYLERPTGMELLLDEMLSNFDAVAACKQIDARLDQLAHVPTVRVAKSVARKPRRRLELA
jgi:hypothetical protein